jgi:hypothetical protein
MSRWKVRRPPRGTLLAVVVKDEMGFPSRAFYFCDAMQGGDEVAVHATYELRHGYARIMLRSAKDLAGEPQVFVSPGTLGYSQATMWAEDERTYGMELLLFPQAAPGFRVMFLVESVDGGSGRTELFVPLSPIAMAGNSVVRSEDGSAWISAGPDAVFQDTYVVVDTQVLPSPPPGLELLTPGYRFGPESALLKQSVVVGIRVPAGYVANDGTGIFCWSGGQDFRPVPGTYDPDANALVGPTEELGTFVLLRDPFPPAIGIAFHDGSTIARHWTTTIRATVGDRGSGVDPNSVQMFVDGKAVPACPEGGAWVHRSPTPLEPGDHTIRLEACDRVGNQAFAGSRVKVR